MKTLPAISLIGDNLNLYPIRVIIILSSLRYIYFSIWASIMRLNSPQTLAAVIRDQRKTQQLTQKETADRVGIKQTTVSGFENNPDQCKIETLFKLLSALDLELHITRRGQSPDKNNEWDQEW